MPHAVDRVRTLNDLRTFVEHMLCQKENLLEDQFRFDVARLMVDGRDCGLQFLLLGPRAVRLSAIWSASKNTIYFYGSCGGRFATIKLSHPLESALRPSA